MNAYKEPNHVVDQKRLLDECIFVVKEQSFFMKQALDNGSLRDTLKHASNMLCELKTTELSPKYYYELYMLIFNELQHLDSFINDKKKHKKKFIDIYESVQHAGNIIPRLYLLIIVGRNYIKNKDIKAKYILKDMTELCKGIQHPLKGLFLRYFLIQMCKDRIPDTGSEYEEAGGGNIDDAFEFLLTNFYESLKLWNRMNDKVIPIGGNISNIDDNVLKNNKIKILKEKMDVKMLVGSILVRMSQLEGMTKQYYIEKCLPKLLLYLSNINDSRIQQYIFESIVQVFSDECHLYSLEMLLNSILKLNNFVDFKNILITLLKRLRSFVEHNKSEFPKEIDIFNLFYNHLVIYVNRTIEQCRNEFDCFNNTLDTSFHNFDKNNNINNVHTNSININDEVSNLNQSNKDIDASQNIPKFSNQNNIHKNSIGNNSDNNNNNIKKDKQEIIQIIIKMLQVLYEFIFLCICMYDSTTINELFELAYKIVSNININDDEISEQVINIIVLPFNHLGLNALKAKNIKNLLNSINDKYKKKLSLNIIDAIIECKNKEMAYQNVEEILKFISCIFYEDISTHKKNINKKDPFNFENNSIIYTSEKISKFFHIITNTNDIDKKYNTSMLFYNYIYDSIYFSQLLPSIIFTLLNIVTKIIAIGISIPENNENINLLNSEFDSEQNKREDSYYDPNFNDFTNKETNINSNPYEQQTIILSEQEINQYNKYAKNIFKFIHTNLLSISNKIPILAFKIFFYSSIVVDQYDKFINDYSFISFDNIEAICLEFITQSLIIYEEDINLSSEQFECIIWAIGILSSYINLLDNENYNNVALKLCQHANKLLKKKDQCIGLLMCSHLYWENQKYRNSTKTYECLQKALKNAEIAIQSNSDNIFLFVHTLKKYLYYYESLNIEVTEKVINYLIDICQEYYSDICKDSSVNQEYLQIIKDIQIKKQTNQTLFENINAYFPSK
ncbi:vacuolar protein sorting-associated protein 35, putative [Plasmodium berghei]|uniref:Vacuolar protein sorting-associated protein 35 n=2 Tax=Plasmodium berghei TaxID=5821 RepID=A0A509AK51_PLABA|nr:vacuolar protein sorting-associated protein 35, putative [Plasmodium berghei ANKA]CXI45697.1 vacuolar protein sorting-associated protein 35, putative [Plasmodium berghei]SCM22701.1 vacuolar protein sorting-associated protein 35, putative [Plasmodium berghei]SCN25606.1 vacuolar protein sorting-associated protein 35, putative [Plasmodium berghei]SCO60553.1 vacuolar protein sorting-associated protein 35, putative [Plasmodium berghei]SCO62306.1 vacuolar protein sorting-associated protein 35, pu|eukprot:XP_034421722.1 vacuolar protein sorting-associated protein 35, putative [Plasmodium berghei ANKA]